MSFSQSELSKKYATAYLQIHEKNYTYDDMHTMWRAAQFLSEHHNLLFYLSLSLVDKESKQRFVTIFIEKFHLKDSLKSLFTLLIKHKNIFLAAYILQDMYGLYKKRNNISNLQITAASELSSEDIKFLKDFFAKKSGSLLVVQHYVDPSLVAGVRLQTETLLWEHSIAKQLRKLKQDVLV